MINIVCFCFFIFEEKHEFIIIIVAFLYICILYICSRPLFSLFWFIFGNTFTRVDTTAIYPSQSSAHSQKAN